MASLGFTIKLSSWFIFFIKFQRDQTLKECVLIIMVSHATLWFRTIAKNILSMSHKQIRVYSLIIDVTGKYTLRKTHTSWCKLKSYGDTDLERRILKAVDSIKNLYHFSLIKNVKRVNKMMDLNREIFFSLLTESTKKTFLVNMFLSKTL